MAQSFTRAICVLIVDDEDDSLDLLRLTLDRMGLEVLTAKSASEALLVLATEHVDLIVADLVMAGRTGVDLLREIRDLAIPAPFIVVTAYGEMESYLEAMNLGAVDYLTKPINSELLTAVVSRTVASLLPIHA